MKSLQITNQLARAPDLVLHVAAHAAHEQRLGEGRVESRLLVAARANLVLHRLVFQHGRTLVLGALEHVARVLLQLGYKSSNYTATVPREP